MRPHPVAGAAGPHYAWVLDVPPILDEEGEPAVDFTGALALEVTVLRPDGSRVVWSSDPSTPDAQLITFEEVSATTLTAVHVYNPDGSDVPWISRGDPRFCEYRFRFLFTVDGAPVILKGICEQYENPNYCSCN